MLELSGLAPSETCDKSIKGTSCKLAPANGINKAK
jgi:hypothetical protein